MLQLIELKEKYLVENQTKPNQKYLFGLDQFFSLNGLMAIPRVSEMHMEDPLIISNKTKILRKSVKQL